MITIVTRPAAESGRLPRAGLCIASARTGTEGENVKRFFSLAVILLVAAPLFALDDASRDRRDDRRGPTVIDEVIRMSEAGVADSAIIAYVNNVREPFAVTADDLIALTNAHVSEAVIRSVQNDSSNRDANARYPRSTV